MVVKCSFLGSCNHDSGQPGEPDPLTMLREELAAGELSNSGVRRHVMVLSQILQSAVEDGRLGRNVAKGIRLPPEQARSMRRLNEAELQRLISATPNFYQPMVMTAAFLGLRWGEITGLGLEHVNFDEATIRVERQMQDIDGKMQFTQPKSKAGYRTVSAPESLMDVLRTHVKRRQELGRAACCPIDLGPNAVG